jgi:hypothetical protein
VQGYSNATFRPKPEQRPCFQRSASGLARWTASRESRSGVVADAGVQEHASREDAASFPEADRRDHYLLCPPPAFYITNSDHFPS